MQYAIPRKYADLVRYGHSQNPKSHKLIGKKISPRNFDTMGCYEVDNNMGLALHLTQVYVRQGFSDHQIYEAMMKQTNLGFVWVRRQDDPEAATAWLLSLCDRTAKPMIPTKHRHRLILALLRTSEVVSQKQVIRHVGTARDSDVRHDLQTLSEAGAVSVTEEQHGQVVWKLVSIAATPEKYWDISYTIRKALARAIARKAFVAQGCKRLPGGRHPKITNTQIWPEPSQEQIEHQAELSRLWLRLIGDGPERNDSSPKPVCDPNFSLSSFVTTEPDEGIRLTIDEMVEIAASP